MPIVDLPLDQRNIIITRSKEGILDIKKIFTSKGANVFDLPAISIGDPDDLNPLDEALNQIMVKQLKNRYNDPTIFKRFVVGVDRAKMRLYDCEQQAQEDILDNKKDEEYNEEEKKLPKKSFAEFKF